MLKMAYIKIINFGNVQYSGGASHLGSISYFGLYPISVSEMFTIRCIISLFPECCKSSLSKAREGGATISVDVPSVDCAILNRSTQISPMQFDGACVYKTVFRMAALISCLQITVKEDDANLLFSGTEKHPNFHSLSVSVPSNVGHIFTFLIHSIVKGYMEMGDFALRIIRI